MSRRQNLRSFPRAAAPAPAAAGHRPLLLAVALAAGFSALPSRAQPSGAQAVVGTAALSQQGNKLVVTTTNGAGNYSSINWQSFSVPGGTTTYFAQPGAASTSINRVVGANPSLIYGTLGSNGRLVLVNPAGITVGAGAVVDTAAFTASTLKMTDADLLAGRLRFGNGLGSLLKVDGTVLASQGDVVLIGQQIETGPQALIQSQGSTVLAAGQKVEITGRGVEGIVFEVQAPDDKVVNLGTLKGDAVAVFAGTLRHSGVIQAQAASTEGGKVVLKALDIAETSGSIVAQGAAGAGGSVDVLGTKVGVLAGATIATSNTASGGSIRIGGDYQGKNADIANAQVTYVDREATLRADATGNGDGGKVIVWADDTTRAYGTMSANAGPLGGNGGLVETSGKKYLDVNGARVSASAANGQAGTWLLDPESITITSGADGGGTIGSGTGGGYDQSYFQTGSGTSELTDGTINTALNAGNGTKVLVTTNNTIGSGSGDITFQGNVNIARTAAGNATLDIDAAGAIRFSGGTTNFQAAAGTSTAAALNVNLASGTGVYNESGATVALSTDSALSDVKVRIKNGQFFNNAGTVTLNQNGQILLNDGATTSVFQNNGTVNGAAGLRGGITGDAGVLGTFYNTGTVDLTQGVFKVGTFTQSAGTFQYGGPGSMTVAGNFGLIGGGFNFAAHDLTIQQDSGSLNIPSFATIAANGGNVVLAASNGSVNVDAPISSTNEIGIAAGSVASLTGGIHINGGITAPKVALEAWGSEGITQTAGGITANELIVYTDSGAATLANAANSVNSLMASVSSMTLVNQGSLVVRGLSSSVLSPLTATGMPASGPPLLADGTVDITSLSGAVTINGRTEVGQLSIAAVGDIVATDSIFTPGNVARSQYGGSVFLNSSGGKVDVQDIDVAATDASLGPNGGSVLLKGTSVKAGNIATSGINGPNVFQPGYAGGVTIAASNGGVTLGTITANGGVGGPTMGGNGGNVLIGAQDGNVSLAGISAKGGDGPDGDDGGSVTIGAIGGSVTLTGAVNTSGGNADGSSTLSSSGGNAGSITIGTSGGSAAYGISTKDLFANGGSGTYGGSGGTIQLGGDGAIQVGGAIQSIGANATDGAGSGGNATLTSALGGVAITGAVDLRGGDSSNDYGNYAGSLTIGAGSGGVTVGGGINATGGTGAWTGGNPGGVTIRATGGPIAVGGAIDVTGGDSGTAYGYGSQGGNIDLGILGTGTYGISTGALLASAGAGASYGSSGGRVVLAAPGPVQVNGAIRTQGADGEAGGGWGGDVTLVSASGSVTVTGSIASSGGADFGSSSSGNGAGNGGAVSIRAGTGISVAGIASRGGSAAASYGANGGSVTLSAGNGAVLATGPIDTTGGTGTDGGYGGDITLFATGGSVTTGAISAGGGDGSSGYAGGGAYVQLTSTSGGVTVNGGVVLKSGSGVSGEYAGELDISAAGPVSISGSIDARGGDGQVSGGTGGSGGYIDISTDGSISTGAIDVSGGAQSTYGSGGGAGSIYLYGGTGVSTQSLKANGGGQSLPGSYGQSGGTIALNSAGSIQVSGSIEAIGSSGTYGPGWGGFVSLGSSGGAVTVTGKTSISGGNSDFGTVGASGGTLLVTAGTSVSLNGVLADGGTSGTSAGGGGGSVEIYAGTSASTGAVHASGGDGSTLGGHGGSVYIVAEGGSLTTGDVDAHAGNATANGTGGYAYGMALQGATGVSTGSINNSGGFGSLAGGDAGSVSLGAGSGNLLVGGGIAAMGGDSATGTGGSGRTVTLSAAGQVAVAGIDTSAGYGPAAEGASAGDILVDAAGTIVLDSVRANGDLGLGTLYLNGSGTLSGTSSAVANVYNAGTIAPGSSGNPIGTFTVYGDYTQAASGRLQLDVVDGTTFIPGVTYDQLRVFGTTTLAGALEVNLVAAGAAPAPAPLGFGPQALAVLAPATTPTVVVVDSSGAINGTFDPVTAPSSLATLLSMSSDGVLTNLPVTNVTAPPPSPAPAPAPVVSPPGTSLADRIYSMLQEDVSRDKVQLALTEQESLVTKFVSLLLKEEKDQADDAKEQGKPDIVSTDAACKPS